MSHSPRIIAFFNQKGGVGKSTIVENLGGALALKNKKVLLIDVDPQCNLTSTFGVDPYDPELNTSHDLFLGEKNVEETIIKGVRKNIDLVPAGDDLFLCDRELYRGTTFWFRALDKALKGVDQYDFILIDNAPYLGSLTINALVAATEIYAPIVPESHALKGIRMMRSAFGFIKDDIERDLSLNGVIINQYNAALTSVHVPNAQILRDKLDIPVFKTTLRVSSAIKKAQQNKQTIFEYYKQDPKGAKRTCEDFANLYNEIIKKGKK